jgi:hypothetical protein
MKNHKCTSELDQAQNLNCIDCVPHYGLKGCTSISMDDFIVQIFMFFSSIKAFWFQDSKKEIIAK